LRLRTSKQNWGTRPPIIAAHAEQSPTRARECPAALSELLDVPTRHKEAAIGQKMLRCCPKFSALWPGPIFVAALFGRICRTCSNTPALLCHACWFMSQFVILIFPGVVDVGAPSSEDPNTFHKTQSTRPRYTNVTDGRTDRQTDRQRNRCSTAQSRYKQ